MKEYKKFIYALTIEQVKGSRHDLTPRQAVKEIMMDVLYYDSKIVVLQAEFSDISQIATGEDALYLLDLPNEVERGVEILATGDRLVVKSIMPFNDLQKRYGKSIALFPKNPIVWR